MNGSRPVQEAGYKYRGVVGLGLADAREIALNAMLSWSTVPSNGGPSWSGRTTPGVRAVRESHIPGWKLTQSETAGVLQGPLATCSWLMTGANISAPWKRSTRANGPVV